MHFNNQTEEKKDNHELESEDMVVEKIEKETEDMNDQNKNDAKEPEEQVTESQDVKKEERETDADLTEEKSAESESNDQKKDAEEEIEHKSEDTPEAAEEKQEETVEPSEEKPESGIPVCDENEEMSGEVRISEEDVKEEEKKEATETAAAENEEQLLPEKSEEPSKGEDTETPEEQEKQPEKEEIPKTEEEVALEEELAQYEETFRNYKSGEIIEGTIVDVNDKEVLVDIGYKSEGSIPITDFTNTEEIKLDSKIKVYINKVENSEGKVSLSKKIADFQLALDDLKEIYRTSQSVSGIIRQRVKGGMIAEIRGLNAFLPGSQISIKPIPNLDQFIGKEVRFRIINIDEQKKNIIVSRKRVLEEEKAEKVGKLREKIEVGAELDGEVKNITDYGAFIDLGGIDGLLHITDMSWGHINHPSEMLNIGDKVKVKVIGYEEKDMRVSLGLKQLVPHPWENVELKYDEGSKITGKVVNITPYGAFVELEPGVEGLVHVSEMSWTKKITNPRHVLKIGDTVNAIVLSVSKEEQKISLGIKQMEANPWLVIDERYPIGTIIKGKVKGLTSFGAFVEIEEDIDGLIHISDISWTKRIYHPKEVLKKGQEVETVVLSVDKHLHRISLGMKQLLPDPWEELDHKLPINTEVTGIITKIIPKGVLVEIDVDGTPIEGFVPISHLAIPRLDKPDMAFNTGDEIPMKVIELDMENRRLILSIKAFFFSKEREALQEFLKKHEPEMRQQAKRAEKQKKAEQAEKEMQEKQAETEQQEQDKPEVEKDEAEEKPEGESSEESGSAEAEDTPVTEMKEEEPLPAAEEKPEAAEEEQTAEVVEETEKESSTATEEETTKEQEQPEPETVEEEETAEVVEETEKESSATREEDTSEKQEQPETEEPDTEPEEEKKEPVNPE
jgi:small subunit ribosomal protein S1